MQPVYPDLLQGYVDAPLGRISAVELTNDL
jgi:hypothetical protein